MHLSAFSTDYLISAGRGQLHRLSVYREVDHGVDLHRARLLPPGHQHLLPRLHLLRGRYQTQVQQDLQIRCTKRYQNKNKLPK